MGFKRKAKRKKMNVALVMVQTLMELVAGLKYAIIEELDKVALLIQIVAPLIISKADMGYIGICFVSCIFVMIVKYIREVGYKLNNVTERGFPIPLERFTFEDENGFISIDEKAEQEAILYLYEVENYLRSKGWL